MQLYCICRYLLNISGDGTVNTYQTKNGPVDYDLWCPCYDGNGKNVGSITPRAIFTCDIYFWIPYLRNIFYTICFVFLFHYWMLSLYTKHLNLVLFQQKFLERKKKKRYFDLHGRGNLSLRHQNISKFFYFFFTE